MDGDRSDSITALAVLASLLSIGTIILRYWSVRTLRNGKLGCDDYLAIASLPFVIVLSSIAFWQASINRTIDTAGPIAKQLQKLSSSVLVTSYIYQFGITLPRLSILCFYFGVFRRTYRWFHISLYALGLLDVCWLFTNLLVTSLQCSPIRSIYVFYVEGTCINQWAWTISLLITSVALDIGTFILPLPIIWKLNVPVLKRLYVAVVFTCGCFVLLIPFGRLITVGTTGIGASTFALHKLSTIEWSLLEVFMSIISVSLPKIFHLFKHARKHGVRSVMTQRPPSMSNDQTHPLRLGLMTIGSKSNVRQITEPQPTDAMSSIHVEDFASDRVSVIRRPHIAYCMYLPEPSPVSPLSFNYSIRTLSPSLVSPVSAHTTRQFSVYRGHYT